MPQLGLGELHGFARQAFRGDEEARHGTESTDCMP
jgi:hypothetical protein